MYPEAAKCLALLGSFITVAACGEGPSEPERFDPSGTLSFSYQGSISGTFAATGVMQPQSGIVPQPVTGATAYRQDSAISLLAFVAHTPTRGDAFSVLLGDTPSGTTVQFDPIACQQQSPAACRIGFFVPGLDSAELAGRNDLSPLIEKTYVLALGSVTVTARTGMRIRGTFTGTAFRAHQQNVQNLLVITGGQFDLPIRPEEPVSGPP